MVEQLDTAEMNLPRHNVVVGTTDKRGFTQFYQQESTERNRDHVRLENHYYERI